MEDEEIKRQQIVRMIFFLVGILLEKTITICLEYQIQGTVSTCKKLF